MSRTMPLKPCLKCFGCEGRDLPLGRHAGNSLGNGTQHRSLRGQIGKSWNKGSKPRPLINPSECISRNRTQAAIPVVGQEFSFVGCHVNVDRAVSLTTFTGKTQI